MTASYRAFRTGRAPLRAAPRGIGKQASPRINVRGVTCPDCHVDPGEDCVNLETGEPLKGGHQHKVRARMARRKANLNREADQDRELPNE